MRKLVSGLLMFGILFIGCAPLFAQKKEVSGSITLSGAWGIYPTVVAWAEAFKKIHPRVKIDISAGGAGKGAADAMAGLVDIGMVSRDPDPAELKKGIKAIYILKDAVYPVISEKNSFIQQLMSKGLKRQAFIDMYITGTLTFWNQVVGQSGNKPIHVYTRSDACGASASWAAYLGKKQEDLKGVGIYGDPGLLETVRRDPAGIGYNNFSFVFTREGALVPGLKLVPIDSNENSQADPDEIYTNRTEAAAAIEAGRYPATRKNYFFIKKKSSGLVKEFIRFALSAEGTRIVNPVGTSLPLTQEEREEVLRTLDNE